ncbi:hypothetical protein KAK06_07375 [Ideonella sp. 4Y11]|uniref:Tfp pilus assembly protein FimV n=1 Tax=Ideonella aquatica TaxID=2824119 RepID=A0A940YIL9_9BURK|nr:hypothetical protein [Ideonella aquatica]MBQ0958776.1 hypothetical protein [Ideonella aquatica]
MALPRATLVIALAASVAPLGAHAVGFGRVTPAGVLGQPLSLLVPIRLDQGEQLYAECIHAEVTAGDNLLVSSQVRVSVTPTANPAEWNARITTTVPLLEPVVEVAVSAGCERRFMRRFTALLDPPLMALSSPTLPSSSLSDRPLAAGSDLVSPRPRSGRSPDSVVRRDRPSSPVRRAEAPVVKSLAKSAAKVAPAAAAATPRAPAEAGERQVARLLLDVGSGPRLRMDIEDPVFMPAGSASAASGAGDGLDSESERLRLLEKTLADLKQEASAYRRTETGLKARLAESEGRSRLVPWLLGLLVLAGGLVGWLLWRQRGQSAPERADAGASILPESKVDSPWWGDGAAPAAAAAPAAQVEADEGEHTGARVVVDFDGPASAPSAYERTQPFTAPMMADAQSSIVDGQSPAREVSVEELLDLEQQADFFIALGQEDAAVDLLMSHLRGTGGQSPLPYTKLLEIYRRQGDRTAYERIRARFNRRFNAYAPDWDQGPQHGRTLEEYPEVVQRLQGLWSSPLNAMAVLEAMLFRNDELQELFDLPAYKDVLLLYSLARDLYQQEGVTAADVDLLLPIGDDAAFAASAPAPHGDEAVNGRDDAYDLTSFNLELQPTEPRPGEPKA